MPEEKRRNKNQNKINRVFHGKEERLVKRKQIEIS